jgi:hypothetical protein
VLSETIGEERSDEAVASQQRFIGEVFLKPSARSEATKLWRRNL